MIVKNAKDSEISSDDRYYNDGNKPELKPSALSVDGNIGGASRDPLSGLTVSNKKMKKKEAGRQMGTVSTAPFPNDLRRDLR